MKKLMNGAQMKRIDVYSIQEVGIPSLVLMERAALCVTEAVLEKIKKTDKVLCVCGSGNNGADGMAVARQLTERGISAEVYTTAEEGKGTEELNRQRAILQKLGIVFVNDIPAGEYNCIIDAVFGIGLSRTITGRYEQIIAKINAAKDTGSLIVAVDTPSGINAGDGQVMGCAVRADMTVTFGFAKCGCACIREEYTQENCVLPMPVLPTSAQFQKSGSRRHLQWKIQTLRLFLTVRRIRIRAATENC